MEWLQAVAGWASALFEDQTLQTLGLVVTLWSLGRLEEAQERTEEKINKLLRKEQGEPGGDLQGRLRRAYAAGANNARAKMDQERSDADDAAANQHQRSRADE